MPAPLHAAVHELGYGTITKTSVQWSGRTLAGGLRHHRRSMRSGCTSPPSTSRATPGILMAYCGGDGGRDAGPRLSEVDRIALATSEMRGDARHRATRRWAATRGRGRNEPRYGGSYAVYRPGQVTAHWQVLREPWGRVHLAGEHVATCTGYMEGALESGESVARTSCVATRG